MDIFQGIDADALVNGARLARCTHTQHRSPPSSFAPTELGRQRRRADLRGGGGDHRAAGLRPVHGRRANMRAIRPATRCLKPNMCCESRVFSRGKALNRLHATADPAR
jgi:hypothetical protein